MLLLSLIFAAAVLYSAVGQAGASGYLAAMAVAGLPPNAMKPAALALNILVATIATLHFARAGRIDWKLLWPFAVMSVPLSLAGGAIHLPTQVFHTAVGAMLLFAAWQLVRSSRAPDGSVERRPPMTLALLSGAVIGLVSGLTGTGGGIFLAPLLMVAGWVETRRAAGISAAFNLVNSVAALGGAMATLGSLPDELPWMLLIAAGGAIIGTRLGTRLPTRVLRYVLGLALVAAGGKMLVSGLLQAG